MPFLFFLLFITSNICYSKTSISNTSVSIADTIHGIPASKVPIHFKAKIISIEYQINNAFEGSKTNSKLEKLAFNLANSLHIKTKKNTIANRLLLKEGDIVNKQILVEMERRLRDEKFLADAIIITYTANHKTKLIIQTFDHFSTDIAVSLQRPHRKFTYTAGIIENNLLGYGQKLGLFYQQSLDRHSSFIQYENTSFTPFDLSISTIFTISEDGYNIASDFFKPLYSKDQKWGWTTNIDVTEKSQFFYLSANVDSVRRENKLGEKGYIFKYPKVKTQSIFLSLIRSFGRIEKINISLDFKQRSTEVKSDGILHPRYENHPQSQNIKVHKPAVFQDYLLGFSFEFTNYHYKTLKNYNNLKWNENLEVGHKLKTSIYQNLKFLNAQHAKLFLQHKYFWFNIYGNHIFTTNHSIQYFLNPRLQSKHNFTDGIIESKFSYQWKYFHWTSTYLLSSWKNYFNRHPSYQLTLGSEDGLISFPNRFFVGQSLLFFQIEERFFPKFEFLTTIPVVAVFLTGGNVFSAYQKVKFTQLNYAAGIGLRIGLTRSVQKIINHFDLAFPIGKNQGKFFQNITFSLTAKTSL